MSCVASNIHLCLVASAHSEFVNCMCKMDQSICVMTMCMISVSMCSSRIVVKNSVSLGLGVHVSDWLGGLKSAFWVDLW